MSKIDGYLADQVPEGNAGSRPKDTLTPKELLTRLEVAYLTGLSPASVDRYRRDGRFPRPISLGPNRVAWVRAEIMEFIAKRIAQRDSAAD